MKANAWSQSLFVVGAVVLIAVPRGVSTSTSLHAQETTHAEPLRTFKGHSKPVNDVVFRPDGKRLASASHDGAVRDFDTASGEQLLTLRGHGENYVRGLTFSPDGKWLASAGWDQNVVLWDALTGRKERTLEAAGGGESADMVAFSPDGKRLLALPKVNRGSVGKPNRRSTYPLASALSRLCSPNTKASVTTPSW